MSKTVLITGASTGFGKLSAQKFQAEGWNVIATMRSPEKETELNQLDNVLVNRLDVTENESIAQAVKEGVEKFGTIDVLVNNAGYGTAGPVEAATDAEIRRQFEVNVFGLINVTKAVLPQMRAQKSGIIINISSVGGRVTFPYFSLYHATKFAVEGLTDSMQYELNPLGIQLKIVEPGGYNTDFGTRSLNVFDVSQTPDYQEGVQKFFEAMQSMLGNSVADPSEVSNTIYEAATDGKEQLRYLIGNDAVQMMELRKQVDDVTFKQTIKQQMGLS
ncbi:short-chain dehydrogenase/reductase [marine bacterium AO1-C]|nr:short-chain dehydrogenase/reductase [marine bacterium AO1-C]